MSAFVAIIRPGCASLLDDFIARKKYTTGVPELDEILSEGEHRMIYQELIMKYLIWLGVEESGSYDIIKKIAKKKFKEPELEELKAKLLKGWIERVGTEDGFIETWTVVEQAAHYSFNASHSLSYAYDSLYGAYLKSHYPIDYYTVAFNYYVGDLKRTAKLSRELKYFGIKLVPIKFRYARGECYYDKEKREIYKGIGSIKDMNAQVAEEMYALKDNQYDSFVDVLYDLKDKTTIKRNQVYVLISLGFFEEFGDPNKLTKVADMFFAIGKNQQIKKSKVDEIQIDRTLFEKYGKETEKQYMKIDMCGLLHEYEQSISCVRYSLSQKCAAQQEYLGGVDIVDEKYKGLLYVAEINDKYTPKLNVYALRNGSVMDFKVSKKLYNQKKIHKSDIIRVTRRTQKQKNHKVGDHWEPMPGEYENWIAAYEIVNL